MREHSKDDAKEHRFFIDGLFVIRIRLSDAKQFAEALRPLEAIDC